MTNPLYSILLGISGLILLGIAWVAWSRRPVAGAVPLAFTMMSMVFWGWMYGIFWLTPNINEKFIWLGLAFVGTVLSSPAFLAMAIEFTGHQDWLTRKFYFAVLILPAIAMVFYITDPWLGLFFGDANFADPKDLMRGGLGFALTAINGYSCTFISIYLFFRYFLGSG